jgi:8-oxo-dGTP diphosphatase
VHGDGNGWVQCARGHRHWGRFGAAGLLLVDRRDDRPAVLMQHRAYWTADGGTWGVPGGARDSHETVVQAAVREAGEEAGVLADDVRVLGELFDDHGDWSYTTVIAETVRTPELVAQAESEELRWVAVAEVSDLPLHPGFARAWPRLRARL